MRSEGGGVGARGGNGPVGEGATGDGDVVLSEIGGGFREGEGEVGGFSSL